MPVLPGLGPAEILHVLRLCDEAVTNVVRHANASRLVIEFGLDEGQLRLCLRDDGTGGARETTTGHGMRNMRKRATQIGGRLDVESGADGTSLVLSMPIELGPPQV